MKLPRVTISKQEIILIAVVFLIAAFFRFYKVADYVVFLGDEGRDMIVMKKMIVDHEFTFLGPTASVGGFYLGPIYYYLAAPFLALWQLNPVGPSYMVSLFGLATVLLLYKFTRDALGIWPAFFASLLYATAPLIVRYSRSSWNPNPLPFFALLLIYYLYLGLNKRKLMYFLLAGACFGIAIQLHYLAIVLVPVSALMIMANSHPKRWPLALLAAISGFLITFSPFLLFEIKHNFPNFKTIYEFVTRDATSGFKTFDFIYLTSNIGNIFLEHMTQVKTTVWTKVAFWLLTLGPVIGFLLNRKNAQKRLIYSTGIIWFVGGLLIVRFYTGQLFDYYFGFMFPAPFLALALTIAIYWKTKVAKVLTIALVAIAFTVFVKNGFYNYPPNRLIQQTEKVANVVIEKSEGQPYNFALISDHNSDHAYKYFLDIKGVKPTELETLITEQLIIVCESQQCAPLGHPIWEIAGFGRGEIVSEWQVPDVGIKVIKLMHWPGEPSPAGKPAQKGV